MIIIGKAGAVDMEASKKFKYEIAPALGLRDVFKLKQEYLSSKLRFEPKEIEVLGEKVFGIEYEEVETEFRGNILDLNQKL